MFFTSYKHFQCFVLLNIIASLTYAAVAPIKVDCWWTGCQLNTWKVVGCDQYNRTQQNIKYCDGGSEYYCCTSDRDKVTPPVDNCWWTGCQLNTWKVVGCNQYNRIQKNVKNCYGGSEYYCCTAGQENMKQPANECWWTGCQLNTWKVVGCDQYNRTQQNIKNCNGGSEYYCCTTGHENVNDKVNEIVTQPANDCWWTGCQLSTWPVVGCDQYNRIQKNVKNCNGGSEYYCCTAGQENLNMNVNVNNKVNENVMQPANDCWWTGCQPNTWLVVGCSQYNRTQQNIKNCDGGSEYYCCTTGQENLNVNVNEKVNENVMQPANDCWWTGCQPYTWLVVGCSQYNRTQQNIKNCDGGSEYYCCTTGQENLNVNVNDKVNENVMQPANDCWWTGCQPNTWLVVGCSQYNRTQKNVKDCYGGSEYYCCTTGQENLNVNVNEKVNENVMQPANDCWWTGCQPNTWLVVGCSQYNRTQQNIKNCDGGSEYYCCTTGQENLNVNVNEKVNEIVTQPANDCWWTGCQPNTWLVVGCSQYNRTQKNVKDCNGGSEYYCCTTGQENLNVNVNDKVNENLNVNVNDKVNENVMQPEDDCWWTECQLNSWEVRVCDSYNRTERERTACELGGLKYECCARREIDNIDVRGGFFEDNCLWSRCQPKEMSGRGCPSNTVQMGLHPCPNGDLFHCCSESISVDVNG
ncbi:uncharacterized protein LOC114126830 [Aphis gossypii]|uniref:Uncharacterized protein n=1 Tax=Aphis gossypii TaxID=80765 RepID=A0A9P0IUP8_APHGO|nr:uncharacterized protein LOC114126830 [Aphis gossypii]CAH1713137.1 unnamed protein product [Aphis gossypii]